MIMPAYNEEACISDVITLWNNLIKTYPGSEILVINDGSKDRTGEVLENLKKRFRQLRVINKKNEGHGATILKGYEDAIKSPHQWIFQTDSDDQFTPEDFGKLWENRHKSNFIIGYRAKRSDPLHRLAISKMIFIFNLIVFGTYIKDANIPYRLMKREYLKALLPELPKNIFAPNIFLSILAAKDGQNLLSMPIRHKARKSGQISIVRWKLLKACFNDVKRLLVFRIKINKNAKK